MSKPVLYGSSNSRAIRSIWAMEETGIEYDHVPTNFSEQSKEPTYLAVNPNGRIPSLVDGDLTMCESMAINLYLAKKYATDLYPDNAEDEARAMQWSVWGISEIEPLQMRIVVQKLFVPEEKRNMKAIEGSEKGLQRPLAVLDAHLASQAYLLGAQFSIADLNLSAVMMLLKQVKMDLSAFENVGKWMKTCYDRPACKRAREKD
ncbi:MAG: glutathione S-transferase family protein [Alphaproteobacteria bacterium]|jgi:glutathione S-transferase|nr:glutathione S-transferase family protein [Alphaproteobacteria bacterium]MBT4084271.1 glutathione S-transferase family protein [Alphaproteobacteria bacterium]MBT4545786.1 glutathione S-transferase family protein [Alphaproteobacteria bacterium]MBT5917425.1 glutathione S-transferase family protein [Alphaproteobacteria bacterium]MBT7746584.1 glutathione S-transferase family protein [Alphaproteobacteria bacterium]